MECKLYFTELAKEDLDNSLSYIKDNLFAPKSAIKLLNQVKQNIKIIISSPMAFSNCELFGISDDSIRHINIGNYVLIYEFCSDTNTITILRFLYSKLDFSKIKLK